MTTPRSRPASLATALLIGCAAAAAACGRAATAPDGPLPAALAARTDAPYVAGLIVDRETGPTGGVRVLVRAAEGSPAAARAEASISVVPSAPLFWRDGRAARPANLTVGRAVVVWSDGPELRSSPPQAPGNAVLVSP